MQLFYFNERDNAENALLKEDELGHCVRTLRKQIGDNLHLIDGLGNLYEGILQQFDKKQATVKITQKLPTATASRYKLHLAVAPTKNIERIEWLLEKAIEIGLSAFTPLLCARSERKTIRIDRLEKIALAAVKQSLNLHLPQLAEITELDTFLAQLPAPTADNSLRYIAHCHENTPRQFLPAILAQAAAADTQNKDIIILIGAEGDFTEKEVQAATVAGFAPISLGNTRLRTETAGLVAATMVAQINYSEK
jgi:16S rRNA (uracil1498-N3)-methyltransferase